jgi:hypothetical protein
MPLIRVYCTSDLGIIGPLRVLLLLVEVMIIISRDLINDGLLVDIISLDISCVKDSIVLAIHVVEPLAVVVAL